MQVSFLHSYSNSCWASGLGTEGWHMYGYGCVFAEMQLRGLSHKTKLRSGNQTSLCMNYIKKRSLPQATQQTCQCSTDKKIKNKKKIGDL